MRLHPGCAVFFLVAVACMVLPVSGAVYFQASTPQIITKGDAFSVSGTGAMNGSVALWVIGRNHFEVRSVAPDRHGNFSLTFRPTETLRFSSGQYAVVLQDPGPDGILEIEPLRDSSGNISLLNRGKIIARFGTVEDLRGNVQPETDTLLSSAYLPGVDDSFTAEYFSVEDPSVQFDGIIPASGSRLPDQVSGEKIVITGTTNLGTGETLLADLRNIDTGSDVTSRTLPILPGSSLNSWDCIFEEPGLEPGNYILSVGWTESNTTGTSSAQFTVRGPAPPSSGPPGLPVPSLREMPPLPNGLDTLLVVGILSVIALAIYAIGGKK